MFNLGEAGVGPGILKNVNIALVRDPYQSRHQVLVYVVYGLTDSFDPDASVLHAQQERRSQGRRAHLNLRQIPGKLELDFVCLGSDERYMPLGSHPAIVVFGPPWLA